MNFLKKLSLLAVLLSIFNVQVKGAAEENQGNQNLSPKNSAADGLSKILQVVSKIPVQIQQGLQRLPANPVSQEDIQNLDRGFHNALKGHSAALEAYGEKQQAALQAMFEPLLLAVQRIEESMRKLELHQGIIADSIDRNTQGLPQSLQTLEQRQAEIRGAIGAPAEAAAAEKARIEAQENDKSDAEVERQSTWLRRAWRAVKETVTPNLQFFSIKKAAINPMVNLAATAAVSSAYVPEGKVKTTASWFFLLHGGYRQAKALETAFTIIKNGNKGVLKEQLLAQAAQKKAAAVSQLNKPK